MIKKILLTLILSIFVGSLTVSAQAKAKNKVKLSTDGVRTIQVTEYSKYIIDTKRDICFYETAMAMTGVFVIKLDCRYFF